MGILDSLENNPALRSALGQLGAAVLPAVMNEVLGSNNQGGLGAIVAKLQQSGFGDQVKSWLGNGQNLPISADQLRACSAAIPSASLLRATTSRSTSWARFWPRNCPRPWTRQARRAICPIPPEEPVPAVSIGWFRASL